MIEKALRSLYFQWNLRKAKFNFDRGAIESILTGNITKWHVSSQLMTGRLYSG